MLNKRQHVLMWFGKVCSIVGTLLIMTGIFWRGILIIIRHRIIGSTANNTLWSGYIILFAGLCIIRIFHPNAKK